MPPADREIVNRVVIKPTLPSEIMTYPIDYHVVTSNTVEEKLNLNGVYMCVSWQDYLTQGQMEQNKLLYIQQLREIIDYYEREVTPED